VRGKLAAAFAAVAIVAAACGSGDDTDRNEPMPELPDRSAQLQAIPQRGTSLGHANAPVTLVEFTELRCRTCGRYDREVLPTLVDRYVRPGKLRLERRVIALNGRDSLEGAAWAAAAARQNALYQFVDKYFWGNPDGGAAFVEPAANEAGLDVERARRYAGSRRVRAALRRTSAQARSAGIEVPAFYISKSGGAQQPLPVDPASVEDFTTALDRLSG
jgi:protein-disulfide isomerase